MVYYLSYMGELSRVSHDAPNADMVMDSRLNHYIILP